MKRLKNIKGAVFDLDGTLLDTNGLWLDVDRAFFARRHMEMPPDYPDSVSAMDFFAAARYTIQRFELTDTPYELLEEWKALTVKVYAEKVKLTENAFEYLTFLGSEGVKLGVATSALPELYVPALKNNGIYDIFSEAALVCTTDVGKGKEYPDVYLRSAEGLGLRPEECAVFEDVYTGVISAKNAGFMTVWITQSPLLRDDYKHADIIIPGFVPELFR